MDQTNEVVAVKKRFTLNKSMITIIILSLLLIVTAGYLANKSYQENQTNKMYQAAAQGYAQALVELVNQLPACKPVPIHIGEQAIDVIAVKCLTPP